MRGSRAGEGHRLLRHRQCLMAEVKQGMRGRERLTDHLSCGTATWSLAAISMPNLRALPSQTCDVHQPASLTTHLSCGTATLSLPAAPSLSCAWLKNSWAAYALVHPHSAAIWSKDLPEAAFAASSSSTNSTLAARCVC